MVLMRKTCPQTQNQDSHMKRIPSIEKEDVEAASETPGRMDVTSNSHLQVAEQDGEELLTLMPHSVMSAHNALRIASGVTFYCSGR